MPESIARLGAEIDTRFVWVGAVKGKYLADRKNNGCRGVREDGFDIGRSGIAPGAQFHLDQFMVIKGDLDFIHHGIGEAVLAHDDDGFQGVRESAQSLDLLWLDFHGGRQSNTRRSTTGGLVYGA